MGNEIHSDNTEALRYLEANAVECPGGKLEGLNLCSQDDETLGVIDGVLVEPASRRLRYFVVHAAARLLNRRRYLVPADSPAVVVPENRALKVEARSEAIVRQRFDSRSVRRFSDDDLLTAMFSAHAA